MRHDVSPAYKARPVNKKLLETPRARTRVTSRRCFSAKSFGERDSFSSRPFEFNIKNSHGSAAGIEGKLKPGRNECACEWRRAFRVLNRRVFVTIEIKKWTEGKGDSGGSVRWRLIRIFWLPGSFWAVWQPGTGLPWRLVSPITGQ